MTTTDFTDLDTTPGPVTATMTANAPHLADLLHQPTYPAAND